MGNSALTKLVFGINILRFHNNTCSLALISMQ